MWTRLLNEPVILAGVVNTGLLMLMAFGFEVTEEQMAAVMAFVNAVLVLLVRAVVTPNQLAEYRVAQGGSPTKPLNG